MTSPLPVDPDDLWTSGEVATYFRVHPNTVSRWAKNGQLRPAFTTPGGHLRFRKSAVIAAGQTQGGES